MEVAEKRITAGIEGPDEDRDRALADDDLFAIEFAAFELLGRGVLIFDQQLDLLRGRHVQLRRLELVVANDQARLMLLRLRKRRGDYQGEQANAAKHGPGPVDYPRK